jgi:AcrR family transcriptional regulator
VDVPPSSRRAPSTPERQRDADRTRRALLDAARAEFAAKGLAGARVNEIADRAGVNKQLISYYFGGKQALYDALVEEWLTQERELRSPDIDLGELVCRYLAVCRAQPDLQRLFVRENLDADLTGIGPEPDSEDLVEMAERKARGEIADELDPAYLLLVLQAAVSASVIFPADVKRHLGLEPDSDEFFRHADAQLRLIVRRLAQGYCDDDAPTAARGDQTKR